DQYKLSKWYTLVWGIFCIVVAMFTYNIGNSLIEAVNVLGSLFYGVILGVFVVAFFFKNIKNGSAVFWAALLGECIVLLVFALAKFKVIALGFLWLNPIGAFAVIGFALLLNAILKRKRAIGEINTI
ncbi:MAG: sodium:solute symporter, partial [Bacteroidetes bacterium]|nr:sodium:solute symporter [Bacteroidota bacterium]